MAALRRMSLITVFLLLTFLIISCGQQTTPPLVGQSHTKNTNTTGISTPPMGTMGTTQTPANTGQMNTGAAGNAQGTADAMNTGAGGRVQSQPTSNSTGMGAGGNVQAMPGPGSMNANTNTNNSTQGTPNNSPMNGNNDMVTRSQGAFIHTTIVQINGRMVHVLTNSGGFLLYYSMDDAALTSNCTGQCAQEWPPLLIFPGITTVTSSIPLPKQLSVQKTANGDQIFYDAHALYTSSLDKQPGQFNGRGQDNKWYLVGFLL